MQLANIAILFILAIFFLVFFVFYLHSKTNRSRIITSLLLGGILAVCAYNFVPGSDYDLVRHQAVVSGMADIESWDGLIDSIGKNNLELLPQLYSFFIGKIGDVNLLQTFIVLIGYALLFYILIDYKGRSNLRNGTFVPLFLLVIFGQYILYYFSGLYNYFAINVFAFAFYLDYIKGIKKIPMLLYVITVLVHGSMMLPLMAVLIFKACKNRLSKTMIIPVVVALLSFDVIIGFVADMVNIEFLNTIKNTYDVYSAHNDKMIHFYDGVYLVMTIIKLAVILLACWLQRYDEENIQIRHFAILFSMIIIILSLSSIAITRFSALALFVAFPVIADAMKNNSSFSRLLVWVVCLSAIFYTAYSMHIMIPLIDFTGVLQ